MDRRTFLAVAGLAGLAGLATAGPQAAAAAGRSIVRHFDFKSYRVRHSATFVTVARRTRDR